MPSLINSRLPPHWEYKNRNNIVVTLGAVEELACVQAPVNQPGILVIAGMAERSGHQREP